MHLNKSFVYNSEVKMNYNPAYMTLLNFERMETYELWRQWFDAHWKSGYLIIIAYLCLIGIGKKLMKNVQPYNLRVPMFIWDILMATISAVGFSRMIPELLNGPAAKTDLASAILESLCFQRNPNSATAFWTLVFLFLKLAQLGNTIFLILRKQHIPFIHIYMHASVNWYCWFAYSFNDPPARWFCVLNYLMDTATYIHFAMKAVKIPVYSFVSIRITVFQTVQMLFGFCANVFTIVLQLHSVPCDRSLLNSWISLIIFSSYFACYYFYISNIIMQDQVPNLEPEPATANKQPRQMKNTRQYRRPK